MTDTLSKIQRSRNMRQIQARDTRPELLVRKLLHAQGFRFRLHHSTLPGRPDIVLPKYGAVIFVHGCFWHAHKCVAGRRPKSNVEYWDKKLSTNVQRDKRVRRQLHNLGWRCLIIWECELRNLDRLHRKLALVPS
ncbi:MAG: DNA mismatch endonuclease Vsr, partial [Ktedonobacteraceae bacterium]|nr:DNA mismatch endonuclease Vsr [Ktedonobacteraceae bacterium]